MPRHFRHFTRYTAACFIAGLCVVQTAQADNILLGMSGGTYELKPGKTFLDQRYRHVVRQQRDFSCGSAALATMLRYHYERDITETEVLQTMFEHGDQQQILKQGFSMLDMKTYLSTLGLKADGFKAPLEKLIKVGIPAIVLLNLNGYLHFVVVRGVSDTHILVADPAYGNRKMKRDDFMKAWNNIVFVITSEGDKGKAHFNTAAQWQYHPKPNFDGYLPVTNISLSTLMAATNPGYF